MATKPRAPTIIPMIRAMLDPFPFFAYKIGVVPGGAGGGVPEGVGVLGKTLSVIADTLNYRKDPSDLPVA
jgi:hypothetical protein